MGNCVRREIGFEIDENPESPLGNELLDKIREMKSLAQVQNDIPEQDLNALDINNDNLIETPKIENNKYKSKNKKRPERKDFYEIEDNNYKNDFNNYNPKKQDENINYNNINNKKKVENDPFNYNDENKENIDYNKINIKEAYFNGEIIKNLNNENEILKNMKNSEIQKNEIKNSGIKNSDIKKSQNDDFLEENERNELEEDVSENDKNELEEAVSENENIKKRNNDEEENNNLKNNTEDEKENNILRNNREDEKENNNININNNKKYDILEDLKRGREQSINYEEDDND